MPPVLWGGRLTLLPKIMMNVNYIWAWIIGDARDSQKMKERIKALALKGFTDKEICHAVDVPERTLNNWKNRYPDFWQSLKDWKKESDRRVERSLFKRACGYSHPEDKIFNDQGEA